MKVADAKPKDIPEIVDLENRVFRGGHDIDMGKDFPTLFCEENATNLAVVRDGGKIVTVCAMHVDELLIHGCAFRAGLVGAVCTDADHRGKGYAGAAFERSIERAFEQGCHVLVVSGGRSLYTRAGTRFVTRALSVTVEREAARGVRDGSLSVEALAKGEVGPVPEIHRRESVRFRRTPADYVAFRGLPRTWVQPCDWFLAKRDGVPVGYYVASTTDFEDGARHVLEMAGERRALVRGLPALLEVLGAATIRFRVPEWDRSLTDEVRLAGYRSEPIHLGGTKKILRFTELMEAMHPLYRELAGREGDELRFAADGEIYTIFRGKDGLQVRGGDRITQLVFGDREREEEAILGSAGGLEQVLRTIFPLPFPGYGVNFI